MGGAARGKGHTDSELVVKTMTVWLPSRLLKGWDSFANADLWRELYDLSQEHDVEWLHVRAHAGNVNNERCDELAKLAAMTARGGVTMKGGEIRTR
ncbi:MAG TPA: hypothetical protein PKZ97_11900 [Azospirillaceae bacterium]|nr:hypothetical protein [Azospirillaceae bacterium]